MLDFEDVTPRKRETEEPAAEAAEKKEIAVENTAAEASGPAEAEEKKEMEKTKFAEQAEGKEGEPAEETAAEEKEEIPQPSVREYHYEEKVKKMPKKKRGWAKLIVGCLIIGISGGTCIGVGHGLVEHFLHRDTAVSMKMTTVEKDTGDGVVYSATDIVKAVKPSVVSVSTTVSGTARYWGGFSIPYEAEGAGSGVIFYSDENKIAIATNNHVVENARTIYVTMEGDVSVPAKVVGTKSESDLAVLTVSWADLREAGITEVTTAVFGDSDHLEVGDSVIAIGNAMGMGLSATDGIISMTEQTINVDGNPIPVLQTSAAINSGNSGGALVNSAGQVIGINTAKYNDSMVEGMGYAIPSNVITPIVDDLLVTGTQPKPYIGIMGTDASLYNLPVGALVVELEEDGPAVEAGLQVGDIITIFNGQDIKNMDALVEAVNEAEIGSMVKITIVRNAEEKMELEMYIQDKNN